MVAPFPGQSRHFPQAHFEDRLGRLDAAFLIGFASVEDNGFRPLKIGDEQRQPLWLPWYAYAVDFVLVAGSLLWCQRIPDEAPVKHLAFGVLQGDPRAGLLLRSFDGRRRRCNFFEVCCRLEAEGTIPVRKRDAKCARKCHQLALLQALLYYNRRSRRRRTGPEWHDRRGSPGRRARLGAERPHRPGISIPGGLARLVADPRIDRDPVDFPSL